MNMHYHILKKCISHAYVCVRVSIIILFKHFWPDATCTSPSIYPYFPSIQTIFFHSTNFSYIFHFGNPSYPRSKSFPSVGWLLYRPPCTYVTLLLATFWTGAQTNRATTMIGRNMFLFILGFKVIGLSLCTWAPVQAPDEGVTSGARGL